MNETDTPRTNAAINASGGQWSFVLLDCSSELERELTAVTEQRDMLTETNNRVIDLLKDGLQTDGSHHKQWYLNKVLKLINADIAKDVEMHWTHDKGCAP